MTEPTPTGEELRFRVDQLDRNQSAIRADMKEGFASIGKTLETVVAQVNTAQKPNYQIAIAAASFAFVVIGSFVTMVKGPSDARLDRLELSQASHNSAFGQMLTKEEYHYERDRSMQILQKQVDGVADREAKHDERIEKQLDQQRQDFESYRGRHER